MKVKTSQDTITACIFCLQQKQKVYIAAMRSNIPDGCMFVSSSLNTQSTVTNN